MRKSEPICTRNYKKHPECVCAHMCIYVCVREWMYMKARGQLWVLFLRKLSTCAEEGSSLTAKSSPHKLGRLDGEAQGSACSAYSQLYIGLGDWIEILQLNNDSNHLDIISVCVLYVYWVCVYVTVGTCIHSKVNGVLAVHLNFWDKLSSWIWKPLSWLHWAAVSCLFPGFWCWVTCMCMVLNLVGRCNLD